MSSPCEHKSESPCHEATFESDGSPRPGRLQAHRDSFHIKRVTIGGKPIGATFKAGFLTAAYCPDCQTVVVANCPTGELRVYCRTCDDIKFVSAERDWERHVYGSESHLSRRRLRAPAVVRRRAKERSRMRRAKR